MHKTNQVLVQVVNEAVTKEHIMSYLDVVKNNLNLSVLNQAMIYLQKPAAKMVCGKMAWESMGRTVNRDARPIVLFFPEIEMTEPPTEFEINNVPQVVGDTNVTMNTKDAVYCNNYIPVNTHDFDSTTGDDIPDKENNISFVDTVLEISGGIIEPVDKRALNIGSLPNVIEGKYDKEQNIFFISESINTDTDHGKQKFNKTILSLYVDYVFDNFNIKDKLLKYAVMYVLYEHYNFTHSIEKTVFIKLDKKSQNEKVDFINDLQFYTSGITQDFDGYYLNFDETAFINNLLSSSEPEKTYMLFDNAIATVVDDILKDELSHLKEKLTRTVDGYLEDLLSLRLEKKLYTYPPQKLLIDKTDYLRKERAELLAIGL